MDAISRLIQGCKDQSVANKLLYEYLARNGQSPEIAIISCSDSRVDPALLMGVIPGEIFSIRNVAGLVPPCEQAAHGYHGTSAGLEFAVKHLKVKHIIVFGHSGCAGIQALIQDKTSESEHNFISQWMTIAEEAKVHVCSHTHLSPEEKSRMGELEAVKISVQNLLSFDWIKERVEKGELRLHGWHYNLNEACLYQFDAEEKQFKAAFSTKEEASIFKGKAFSF